MLPSELRRLEKTNPRDYYKLRLINEGRKAGAKQIALANKIQASYNIEL